MRLRPYFPVLSHGQQPCWRLLWVAVPPQSPCWSSRRVRQCLFFCVFEGNGRQRPGCTKIVMLWVDRSSDFSSLMPNTKALTSRRLRCINTLEDHNPSECPCTHRHKLVGRSENPFNFWAPASQCFFCDTGKAPRSCFPSSSTSHHC